jgi:hypothetical protein
MGCCHEHPSRENPRGISGFTNPPGWLVASLHRKRLGGREPGRRRELRAEAFSIRRLEGSRWCLRRTLAIGIGCRFGTGKTDNDRVDHSGNRGYRIPDGTVELLPEERKDTEGVPSGYGPETGLMCIARLFEAPQSVRGQGTAGARIGLAAIKLFLGVAGPTSIQD